MSADIIIASLLVAALSPAAYLVGRYAGGHLPRARNLLFASLVIGTSLYAALWVGRLENLLLFPWGHAILISNLTPIFVCFLAGYARRMPGAGPVRTATVGCMVVLGCVFFLAPVLRPLLFPIQSQAHAVQWDNGVYVQTHDAACAPAAAVTLLHRHGIAVSEQAMIEYCLTSRAGTEPLALYRGLVAATRDSGLKPRLADSRPEAWSTRKQFPVLAMVCPSAMEFEPGRDVGPLRNLLGRRSDGHAVVILGRTPSGDYIVGDPGEGLAAWDPYVLETFFTGQALYLHRSSDGRR